jgi:hypothetical protein
LLGHADSGLAARESVASPSRYVYIPVMTAATLDPRLKLWLGSLAALAAVNVALWIGIARSAPAHSPYVEAQLLLSGIYVGVCGFRSLFPRVDLERVCLWDTWLSAILLGRTLATIAEVCFALQCGLFLQRLADIAHLPVLAVAAQIFVPLVIVAEAACWYAVLSLDHSGHALEEALWALLMLVLAVGAGAAALSAAGTLRWLLVAGCVVYGVGAALTLAVDVRMYIRRWRTNAAVARLPLATGLRDSGLRRQPTAAWAVWREEVPWMTVYFSIGVWTSLAMVLLDWA